MLAPARGCASAFATAVDTAAAVMQMVDRVLATVFAALVLCGQLACSDFAAGSNIQVGATHILVHRLRVVAQVIPRLRPGHVGCFS